jgi:hypothetical protein
LIRGIDILIRIDEILRRKSRKRLHDARRNEREKIGNGSEAGSEPRGPTLPSINVDLTSNTGISGSGRIQPQYAGYHNQQSYVPSNGSYSDFGGEENYQYQYGQYSSNQAGYNIPYNNPGAGNYNPAFGNNPSHDYAFSRGGYGRRQPPVQQYQAPIQQQPRGGQRESTYSDASSNSNIYQQDLRAPPTPQQYPIEPYSSPQIRSPAFQRGVISPGSDSDSSGQRSGSDAALQKYPIEPYSVPKVGSPPVQSLRKRREPENDDSDVSSSHSSQYQQDLK